MVFTDNQDDKVRKIEAEIKRLKVKLENIIAKTVYSENLGQNEKRKIEDKIAELGHNGTTQRLHTLLQQVFYDLNLE